MMRNGSELKPMGKIEVALLALTPFWKANVCDGARGGDFK